MVMYSVRFRLLPANFTLNAFTNKGKEGCEDSSPETVQALANESLRSCFFQHYIMCSECEKLNVKAKRKHLFKDAFKDTHLETQTL